MDYMEKRIYEDIFIKKMLYTCMLIVTILYALVKFMTRI